MYGHTDARSARDRIGEAFEDLDRVQEDSSPGCSICVGVTFSEGAYPASAGAYYALNPQTLSGPETEGAGGGLTAFAAVIHAYNLGSAIPPPGTAVIVTQSGDRWAFSYS